MSAQCLLWIAFQTQVGHLATSESANSGREQMQQHTELFDHLVGGGEQRSAAQ
jgi:hypothetical protein